MKAETFGAEWDWQENPEQVSGKPVGFDDDGNVAETAIISRGKLEKVHAFYFRAADAVVITEYVVDGVSHSNESRESSEFLKEELGEYNTMEELEEICKKRNIEMF